VLEKVVIRIKMIISIQTVIVPFLCKIYTW